MCVQCVCMCARVLVCILRVRVRACACYSNERANGHAINNSSAPSQFACVFYLKLIPGKRVHARASCNSYTSSACTHICNYVITSWGRWVGGGPYTRQRVVRLVTHMNFSKFVLLLKFYSYK